MGLASAVAIVAAFVFTRTWFLDRSAAELVGSALLVCFPLFTAASCWWCAIEMSSRRMKVQWVLLGAAALAFGTGQVLEEFLGQAGVEGFTAAKALYLLAIVTFGAGTWMALRSFIGFLDIRGPMRVSIAFAAAMTVIGGLGLANLFRGMDATLTDKILLGAYPIGLLWLMALPALALALTVSQMGAGALARPWWAVFVGVSLLTVSNIVLVIITALAIPITDSGPMEFGWFVGLSSIALGAAMQIDVQKPATVSAE
jgi:hypothetical protein